MSGRELDRLAGVVVQDNPGVALESGVRPCSVLAGPLGDKALWVVACVTVGTVEGPSAVRVFASLRIRG